MLGGRRHRAQALRRRARGNDEKTERSRREHCAGATLAINQSVEQGLKAKLDEWLAEADAQPAETANYRCKSRGTKPVPQCTPGVVPRSLKLTLAHPKTPEGSPPPALKWQVPGAWPTGSERPRVGARLWAVDGASGLDRLRRWVGHPANRD